MAETIQSLEGLASLKPAAPEAPKYVQKLDAQGRAYATGKRKNAVARVWIKPGSGKILVNTKTVEAFFARPVLRMLIQQPLVAANRGGQYDITCTVSGGGLSGQAGAVRHGLSKALTYYEPDLRGALKTPVVKHRSFLKENELPLYLRRLEAYDGSQQTRLALRFLLLTFVRTNELRAAQWTEIDWDKAEWRIPAERMKMKELHIVPLSRQTIAVLRELEKHSGNRQYIFPNEHRPVTFMSENTMLYALYRMGYHSRATGHGFRSTASTILNEHGFRADVIERQLAHSERNNVRAAYNHAQYLPERRQMMQWWADHLDEVAARK